MQQRKHKSLAFLGSKNTFRILNTEVVMDGGVSGFMCECTLFCEGIAILFILLCVWFVVYAADAEQGK